MKHILLILSILMVGCSTGISQPENEDITGDWCPSFTNDQCVNVVEFSSNMMNAQGAIVGDLYIDGGHNIYSFSYDQTYLVINYGANMTTYQRK